MTKNQFPRGWDEKRVNRVLAHYDEQSDDETVTEDAARVNSSIETIIAVPPELVPAIRNLIARTKAV